MEIKFIPNKTVFAIIKSVMLNDEYDECTNHGEVVGYVETKEQAESLTQELAKNLQDLENQITGIENNPEFTQDDIDKLLAQNGFSKAEFEELNGYVYKEIPLIKTVLW